MAIWNNACGWPTCNRSPNVAYISKILTSKHWARSNLCNGFCISAYAYLWLCVWFFKDCAYIDTIFLGCLLFFVLLFVSWRIGIGLEGYPIQCCCLWKLFLGYLSGACGMVISKSLSSEICKALSAILAWGYWSWGFLFSKSCSEGYISSIMSLGVISANVIVGSGFSLSSVITSNLAWLFAQW